MARDIAKPFLAGQSLTLAATGRAAANVIAYLGRTLKEQPP